MRIFLLGNNGILLHDLEVLRGDDITVASGGDEDVSTRGSIFHSGDFVAGHSGLEGVDGVNLCDKHSAAVRPEGLSTLAQF